MPSLVVAQVNPFFTASAAAFRVAVTPAPTPVVAPAISTPKERLVATPSTIFMAVVPSRPE